MDANDLARWTRFAAKGGIGKCTATQDCVAESPEDLMFLKDDEITVLMQLPDKEGMFLGYCEGVVGRFHGIHVQFLSKLKKPIMAKRSSVVAAKSPTPTPKSPPSPSPSSSRRSSRPPTDDEAILPPTMSFSSSSTLSDGSLITPPLPLQSDRTPPKEADSQYIYVPLKSPPLVLTPTSPLVISPKVPQNSHITSSSPPAPISTAKANNPGLLDTTFGDEPPSARYSVAMSDDGELGIGLSLLRGLANPDDDWSSVGSRYSLRSNTPDMDDERHTVSGHHKLETVPPDTPHARPHQSNGHTPSPPPQFANRPRGASVASSSSNRTKMSDDQWEGASDIYDNYRYSRLSQASKASRLSQVSHKKDGSIAGSIVPPVPVPDVPKRPESGGSDSDGSVYTQASIEVPSVPFGSGASDSPGSKLSVRVQPPPALLDTNESRPIPLELNPNPSPLLHTTWGSATSSPSIYSAGSFFSPPPSAPSYPGAATALRQRIVERSSPSPQSHQQEFEVSAEAKPRRIVVEDDEEIPAHITRDSILDRPIRDSTFDNPFNRDSRSLSPASTPPLSPMAEEPELLTEPPRQTATPEPPSTPQDSEGYPSEPSSPSPPDLPPPPSASAFSPTARIPRPSLSEFRGDTSVAQRTSLFVPHPGAPKPSTSSAGPMYVREPLPSQQSMSQPSSDPAAHAVNIIKAAMTTPVQSSKPGPPGATSPGPTIYGKVGLDLSSASGPVPIVFSLQPPPPPASTSPARAPPSPLRTGFTPGVDNPRMRSGSANLEVSTANAIPRANFFPKAGTARPRSRSFSGFNKATPPVQLPSLEEPTSLGGRREHMSTLGIPRSTTAPQSDSPPGQPRLGKHASTSKLRPTLQPSPLSLPQNIILSVDKQGTAPPSPMGRQLLRKSRSTLNESTSPVGLGSKVPLFRGMTSPEPSTSSPQPLHKQTSFQSLSGRRSLSHSRNPTGDARPMPENDNSSIISNGRSNMISPQPPNSRTNVVSPAPLMRETSLRSKLSLPNLRRSQSRQNSISSISSPVVDPSAMVQVQDMDFELIRPTMSHTLAERTSMESFGGGREPSLDSRSLSAFRSDSPAMSMASNSGQLSPVISESGQTRIKGKPPGSTIDPSIDAHRQRELKWINLMSSTPASQSRKSKKVRKLLGEGVVPSSVRYMVWSHLMDGKAKNVPGVYMQFGQRGRVPAFGDIERDVRRCFADHPQLLSAQGPLLSLLQAYLTMVPDVQYTTGLTLISGHLLLLAPEEDAFWTFVSIMDTYLRPYFSGTTQMEVDAALFAKALEANDSQVARKVLVDMSMPPGRICYPWFTTLFIGTLPTDFVNRIWDLFLYEGMPFLLRVGLAIVYCCRRAIQDAKNEDAVLSCLKRPHPQLLPPTPDAFVSLALTMKLKDDDIKKQRVKMEAQIKRQTQLPRTSNVGVSLPRS